MKLRIGRIVAAALAVEVLGVLALVLIVMLFGPGDRVAAEAYAERLGFWVGPISGFVFSLLGGYWVARGAASHHIHNGFATGTASAAVDIAILLAVDAPFLPIFAISNAGRVIAGTLGGWLASRATRV